MHTLTAFWLPILLSAAAVWIASAMAWMAMPHHKRDHVKLPDEKAFTVAVKSLNIPAGNYKFPDCDGHKNMKDPEFQKRWKEGPNGMMSVWGANLSMGRNMVVTFVLYIVISYVIAYLVADAVGLRQGAPFMEVFRVVGTAGVLAYSFSFIPSMVWFNAYPRAIVASVVDGVVYGLITGAIFAACWPAGH